MQLTQRLQKKKKISYLKNISRAKYTAPNREINTLTLSGYELNFLFAILENLAKPWWE